MNDNHFIIQKNTKERKEHGIGHIHSSDDSSVQRPWHHLS